MTVRRSIRVSGLVQGVGFRPFVFRLASQLGLTGFVRNQGSHVLIQVEGTPESIDRFPQALRDQLPPLARVDHLEWEECPAQHDATFEIIPSAPGVDTPISVAADVATCPDCLAELFDPHDRRYRYPFLNCTNCGPRLTIITDVPYDRANTTMAPFAMCAACRREYEDPANRRFHAEPIACPDCGPRLMLADAQGRPFSAEDPLQAALDALRGGRVVTIKGLGGYHLACLATDPQAVSELRRRKYRDEKPFAIMVRSLAAAGQICQIAPSEAHLLEDARRPIVLLRRRLTPHDGPRVADAVAPANPLLGVMLPYTPLHHLLMAALGDEPLVMTSGNRSDEPIAYEDADALRRLGGIADLFLTHDRAIHRRCDDSVVRVCEGEPLILRRSRGYVPEPIVLPFACPLPTLAVGGQLKAIFALGKEDRAILSHHCGDLDDFSAVQAYTTAITHFERFFDVTPELIVHDLHPDYASTQYALQRRGSAPTSKSRGVTSLGVQHHHAHLASCLADNGLDGPAIGVIFDGTGYGLDGTVWGGEFLVGDCAAFHRAAHFRNVAMPGGEQAIREPWRMAAAYLLDAVGEPGLLLRDIPAEKLKIVETMVSRQLNAPLTSSAGRLFDAVAAIAGVRRTVTYEGQAAVELEWLATGVQPAGSEQPVAKGDWLRAEHARRRRSRRTARCLSPFAAGYYPYSLEQSDGADETEPMIIDTRPLIAAVADDVRAGVEPAAIARRFHSTVVEIIISVCTRIRAVTRLDAVALSGGVFMNALVLEEAAARLAREGFQVLRHRRVPPNDGGLSLGQLAVAAARMSAAAAKE